MLSVCTVILGNDFFQSLSIDTEGHERLMIWKIREKTHFVLIVDQNVPVEDYAGTVEECLEIIEQSKSA
ncbi:hypothetical protein EON65_17095 [archaeon]|nr:MAG: hypothetical protein EON65_17095 [archaeon]